MLREGSDLAIVALGTAGQKALDAAALLQAEGMDATGTEVRFRSFNPFPADGLADLLEKVPLVVTVEAHYADRGGSDRS